MRIETRGGSIQSEMGEYNLRTATRIAIVESEVAESGHNQGIIIALQGHCLGGGWVERPRRGRWNEAPGDKVLEDGGQVVSQERLD